MGTDLINGGLRRLPRGLVSETTGSKKMTIHSRGKIMKYLPLASISLVFLLLSNQSCYSGEQAWPSVDSAWVSNSSVRNQINGVFKAYADNCGLVPAKPRESWCFLPWGCDKLEKVSDADYTNPLVARESTALNFGVRQATSVQATLMSLMSNIFTEDDLKTLTSKKEYGPAQFGSLLRRNDWSSKIPKMVDGLPYFVFSHKCQTYYSAAQELNLAFLGNAAEAAINADSKTKSQLYLLYGVFKNPIVEELESNKLTTLLEFWDAYTQGNNDAFKQGQFLLNQVEAVSTMRSHNEVSQSHLSGSVAANFEAFFMASKIDGKAAIEGNRTLDVSDPRSFLIVNQPTPTKFTYSAPTPTLIESVWKAKVAEFLAAASINKVLDGTEDAFTIAVPEIPEGMCTPGLWEKPELNPSTPAGVVKTIASEIAYDHSEHKCKIGLRVKLDEQNLFNSDLSQPTATKTYYPSVTYTRGLKEDTTSKPIKLTLTIARNIDARVDPTVMVIAKPPVVDANLSQHTWHLDLSFNAIARDLDEDRGAVMQYPSKIGMQCGGENIGLSVQATFNRVNKLYDIALSTDANGIPWEKIPAVANCNLGPLKISIPVVGGLFVDRPLFASLQLPTRPTAASATAPAGNTLAVVTAAPAVAESAGVAPSEPASNK
jgi:hypothetical protein